MIDYNCRPYVLTVGISSWMMMVIGIVDLTMFTYAAVDNGSFAGWAGFYILAFICIFLAGCGIMSSHRYFNFTDDGIHSFDKHKMRYNNFHKWDEFPIIYVFYYYRSYRIIFTTKALSRNEQIDFVRKSHKMDPYIKGYDGFLISTFEKDKRLHNILKMKYGIGYGDRS